MKFFSLFIFFMVASIQVQAREIGRIKVPPHLKKVILKGIGYKKVLTGYKEGLLPIGCFGSAWGSGELDCRPERVAIFEKKLVAEVEYVDSRRTCDPVVSPCFGFGVKVFADVILDEKHFREEQLDILRLVVHPLEKKHYAKILIDVKMKSEFQLVQEQVNSCDPEQLGYNDPFCRPQLGMVKRKKTFLIIELKTP
jgi:hypothetical protein